MATAIDLEDGWKQIKTQGIDRLLAILEDGMRNTGAKFTNQEFSRIYTVCYAMCTQRTPYNWSAQLYARHEATFKSYLTDHALPALREAHGAHILGELAVRWQRHEVMNKWMHRFFMYLDRYHVQHHMLPKLKEAGTAAFKQYAFDPVSTHVASALLDEIDRDRDGAHCDASLIKRCVEVFVAVGQGSLTVYLSRLEQPLLAATRDYYRRRSQDWLSSCSSPEFLRRAETALVAEAQRVERYLHESTESALLEVVEEELMEEHALAILEREGSGLMHMLQDDRGEDLARLYRLFSRVKGGLAPIAKGFRRHLEALGADLVSARISAGRTMPGTAAAAAASAAAASGAARKPARRGEASSAADPAFVTSLLELHDRAKHMVASYFGGSSLFQKALRDAFESFVNKEVATKVSNTEMIATFCDRVLRGSEKLSDAEVEGVLERVVGLFAFIVDKDRFGEIYRNQLAKRLLNGRSASADSERSMIAKLKLRCGAQYTSKLEGMMSDLQIGHDQTRDYQAWCAGAGKARAAALPCDFGVQVLTTGWWPSFRDLKPAIPRPLKACQAVFEEYYAQRTTNRRLAWCLALGSAAVTARFGGKRYELSVSSIQAICLLLFNSFDEATPVGVKDVSESLSTPDEVTKRVLHSLACGKHRVLSKTPPGRSISVSDKFAVNPAFKSALLRVRLPMASLDESHSVKKVTDDRRNAIDAAIVRTMKASKRLSHTDLFASVLRILQTFRPDPKLVKTRIEYCIDNDYIERDDADASMYLYVA